MAPETKADGTFSLADSLLQELAEVVISNLSEVEFFSLASRQRRIGEFSEAIVRSVLMKFQQHLEEGFYRRITIEAADYQHARGFLAELNTPLRSLDALHVAVAARHKLVLTSSDRIQARGAEQFGVAVLRVGGI